MQSSSQIITTNKPTPSFLQTRCPSCRPTNSVKTLKGTKTHVLYILKHFLTSVLTTLLHALNVSIVFLDTVYLFYRGIIVWCHSKVEIKVYGASS